MKKYLSFIFLVMVVLAYGQSGVNVGLVMPQPSVLNIAPGNTVLGPNQTQQFTAEMLLSDGTNGGNFTLLCGSNWTSSTPSVATINNNGLVTAVAAGSATISCTIPGSLCSGGTICTGSTTLTVHGFPVINNPTICSTPPCPLPQGFGPPGAVAYSFSFGATGGVLPYAWTCTGGTCPGSGNLSWATLSSGGVLSGTPNAVANTSFTVQVCDAVPNCAPTLQVSLQIVAGTATTFYPNSTTSQLANNLVAGCNSNSTVTTCGTGALAGTAASTTYSVTSNIVTLNVANSYVAGSGAGACIPGTTCGSIIGISGCTSATFLNGSFIAANSSTTATAIVGPWFNSQQTAQTHANVGSTGDTTCYAQGQGWQPFVTAPFPAVGTANCTLGNGQCPGGTLTMTQADINTCSFDNSLPSGALNTLNKNVMTLLTNSTTGAAGDAKKTFSGSRSGETNDNLISILDANKGFFFGAVTSGATKVAHAHIGATACGQGIIMDTPVESGWWFVPQDNFGGPSFNPNSAPGLNQALWYTLNLSNNYDPQVEKHILTYNATGCAGLPCVTATTTVIADLPTICPAWKYTTIGTGLGQTTQFGRDMTDNSLYFGLGSGGQGSSTWHMMFHLYNISTTAKCENWDLGGFSGGGIFSAQATKPSSGSGYPVNSTLSATCGAGSTATFTVTAVNGSGGVTAATLASQTGSCWNLQTGLTTTGGGGSGATVDITGIGALGTTQTIWPSGATTPTATTIAQFGAHSGNMDRSGTYGYVSGWATTSQSPCNNCVYMMWTLNSTTLTGQTSPLTGGHPGIGYQFYGVAQSPGYTKVFYGDPGCNVAADCTNAFTQPCNAGTAAALQMHSSWVSPNKDQSMPFLISDAASGPTAYTNPPNWPCPFAMSVIAVDQQGVTRWPAHFYTNIGNGGGTNAIAGDAIFGIWASDQGGPPGGAASTPARFILIPMDCFANYAGNTGCGVDNRGAPYTPLIAIMLN